MVYICQAPAAAITRACAGAPSPLESSASPVSSPSPAQAPAPATTLTDCEFVNIGDTECLPFGNMMTCLKTSMGAESAAADELVHDTVSGIQQTQYCCLTDLCALLFHLKEAFQDQENQ